MRRFSFLILLFLSVFLATSHAYMDPLEDGEDENDDGELDPDDETPRIVGQRCGSRNQCAMGYDCVRAPVRRRCYPVECGVQAIRETIDKTGFDLEGYGQAIMDAAGVTRESNMFNPFPDAGLNLFNRDTEDVMKVNEAIITNRPPIEFFLASFNNCTGNGTITNSTESTEATTVGVSPYFGASWELGAIGTYNGDIFWGQGTSDGQGLGLLNNCFGVVLGYDAGISGLIGLAFTGTISDLAAGCKLAFPIFDFPPFGLQLGFIASESPTFFMEFTGGLSASAGLPGFTTCTTTVL